MHKAKRESAAALLLKKGQQDETPWMYERDPEAAKAYVAEIRRRQPSAFKK